VIDLSPDQVTAMPVDQLGLLILSDLLRTDEWNEYNYLLSAQRSYRGGEPVLAITEAMAWLRARALIARTPGQTSDAAITVTRTGRRVAAEGPTAFRASERLQGGIHPQIERKPTSTVPDREVRAGGLRVYEGRRGARPPTGRVPHSPHWRGPHEPSFRPERPAHRFRHGEGRARGDASVLRGRICNPPQPVRAPRSELRRCLRGSRRGPNSLTAYADPRPGRKPS
jgi:hypothetical protein